MCTESDQAVNNRASCFLNMNDSQNQNSFDFVPKSDYNEKWYLENKCLFHNQQYLEGDKYGTKKLCTECPTPCDLCSHFKEKFKSKTDGNNLNERSGDWKCDEELGKKSLKCIVQDPPITEWKWKNPYSVSDFDRSKRWSRRSFTSEICFPFEGDDVITNLLRDLHNKDSLKDHTKNNFLYNFREYLVRYQESCGVPRTEYSFWALINTMGQATGRSFLALLYVILNIIPVVEVFLYLLRFVLDKVISISNSKDFRQTVTRCLIFTTELFSVYVCLIFIFGFIVLPIVHMVIDIVAKIMLYN
ncbi:uncharacterized protein LOC126878227 [Bombus huntii]|uniref:uncharacterized protein LOC126878227 n=1 Tax=Bombus huntii TaxID=85661 RepID=UPI0021AAC195|nr:uncharacterized protein LOC126878227 [Bombus huntii]